MRWFVAAFVAVGVCAASVNAQPDTVDTTCPTVRDHNRHLKKILRYGVVGVGDYRASTPSRVQFAKLGAARGCMKQTDRAKYRLMRGAYEKRVARWRFHRQIDRATPFGEWSIPGYIVACESGGSYTVFNQGGSDASGAYQFLGSTWLSMGGGKYSSAAAYAPPWAQHLIAARLYASSGTSPWECA